MFFTICMLVRTNTRPLSGRVNATSNSLRRYQQRVVEVKGRYIDLTLLEERTQRARVRRNGAHARQ